MNYRTVRVSIETPSHTTIETRWGKVFILSNTPVTLPRDIAVGDVFGTIDRQSGEWSALICGPGPNDVLCHRPLTSGFSIYYGLTGTGDLVISDRFSTVLHAVPPQQRMPDDDAVVEHFLFRTTTGKRTYARGVFRLGHGDALSGSGGRLSERSVLNGPLTAGGPVDPREVAVPLKAALDRAIGDRAAYLSFSGGVDSTLLAALRPDLELRTAQLTAPEAAPEEDYARSTADILGRDISVSPISEAGLGHRLTDLTDRLGFPVFASVVAVQSVLFANDTRACVLGQYADTLFGLLSPHDVRLPLRPHLRMLARAVLRRPHPAAPKYYKATRMAARAPTDTTGLASRFGTSRWESDALFNRIFGAEAVARAHRARFDYTLARASLTARARYHQHLELGHLVDFFCDNGLSSWREVATAHGAAAIGPFSDRDVVTFAASMPAETRYVRDGRVKWALKDALRREVPTYPIDTRKLMGSVPNVRLARAGMFGRFGSDYPRPDFLTEDTFNDLDGAFRTTWILHSYGALMQSRREDAGLREKIA